MNKNYFTCLVSVKSLKTSCFLLVICFLFSNSSYSQTTNTLTSSGTLEIPAGVTSLSVQAWGAGGGGGGSNELLGLVSLGAAGGGGGGGAYSAGIIPVTPVPANAQFTYTVGQGGAGGSTENINGLNGGTSSFSTISAGGGGGGVGGVLLSGAGAGLGSTAGDYSGGNGGSTYLTQIEITVVPPSIKLGINRSGGGGGSAGTTSNGNNASGLTGGTAVTGGGVGGNGGEKQLSVTSVLTLDLLIGPNVKGSPGGFPGGGGGGGVGNGLVSGLLSSANSSNGGNGGDGLIKVTYTCPTYSISSLTADTDCEQSSTITLHSTPEGLPIGTYAVTYTIDGGVVPPPPATMVVETAGTGTIEVQDLRTVGVTTVTITHLSSVDCSTAVNTSIVFDRPTVPVQGTITHPTCAEPTGSVELSDLPSGSWTISPGGYTGTGSTATISGLASGTQNFVVSNGDCSSQTVSVPFTVVINDPPPTRTWNGAWDVVPTIENKVVFETSYDENDNVEACSCQVNSGAHVIFKTGRYLKIRNELEVDSNGSLTFENNASLIQINDESVNSGDIIYKRYTNYVKRYDYTYWSSPVVGQTLKNLSPNTLGDKYYSYDPSLGWVIHYNGNKEMIPGEGYIIRAPQTFSTTTAAIDYSPQFEGEPNNGEVSKELPGASVCLLGNPYPSALSADAFLNENDSKLEGTLYFWAHNSPPSINVDGDAIYNYTTNDYATYNLTGGVATHAAAVEDEDENDPNDNNNFDIPTGNIAAAQGFFAPTSDEGGTIVFNNSMRLLDEEVMDDAGDYGEVRDNSQFFKLGKSDKSTVKIEKNRLWLNLTNAQGAFKQTLIGYITGATNDYEGRFDGISYDGNQYIDFYSVNQDLNLTIQGRALPFQQNDTVALGYKSTIAGDFKISIDHADGSLASQKVFLEDKVLQVYHDLKEPYSFTTEKGIFNDRFVLRYHDKSVVVEDVDDASDVSVETVLVSTNNKVITINTANSIIDSVLIYNFSGDLIKTKHTVNAVTTTISDLAVSHVPLLVKVQLENGKKAVKKIIY